MDRFTAPNNKMKKSHKIDFDFALDRKSKLKKTLNLIQNQKRLTS